MSRTALSKDLLQVAAHVGARRIALRQLSVASGVAKRLTRDGSQSTVHDFRVATRRLWTTLKAYWPFVSDSLRKAELRELLDLRQDLGDARDAEVRIQTLRKLRARLGPAARGYVQTLIVELQSQASDANLRRLHNRFAKLEERLSKAIDEFELHGRISDGVAPTLLGTAAAEALRPLIADLAHTLLRVEDAKEIEGVHQARGLDKRIRYVLEQFADDPDIDNTVERLKHLQTVLGDLHDVQMLKAYVAKQVRRSSAPEPSDPTGAPHATLSDAIREARAELFGQLRQRFLGSLGADLIRELERAADALDAAGRAGLEIERKYLLKAAPKLPAPDAILHIEQGYLPGKQIQERLRRIEAGGRVAYLRTIKAGTGIARLEVEEPISPKLFNQLWPLTEGRRVVKTRTEIRDGAVKWCIDAFHGRTLHLAEVELLDERAPVAIPPWLKKHVAKEVTTDARYTNAKLAQ